MKSISRNISVAAQVWIGAEFGFHESGSGHVDHRPHLINGGAVNTTLLPFSKWYCHLAISKDERYDNKCGLLNTVILTPPVNKLIDQGILSTYSNISSRSSPYLSIKSLSPALNPYKVVKYPIPQPWMTGNKVPSLHIPILKADHDISNIRHRYGTDTHYARFQSSINYTLRSIFSEVLRVLQDQIILRMMDFAVSCIPGIGHFPDNLVIMYQYGAIDYHPLSANFASSMATSIPSMVILLIS